MNGLSSFYLFSHNHHYKTLKDRNIYSVPGRRNVSETKESLYCISKAVADFSLFDLQAVIYESSEEEADEEDGADALNGLCQNKNTGALKTGAAAPRCSSSH